jgi:hypothetical protein
MRWTQGMQALSACIKWKTLDNKETRLAKNDKHTVLMFRRSGVQLVGFGGLCENPNGGIIQNADLRSDRLPTKALVLLVVINKTGSTKHRTLLQYGCYDMWSKYRLCKKYSPIYKFRSSRGVYNYIYNFLTLYVTNVTGFANKVCVFYHEWNPKCCQHNLRNTPIQTCITAMTIIG